MVCPGGGTGISLYNLNLIKALKKRFNCNIHLLTSKDYEFFEVVNEAEVKYLTTKFYSSSNNKFIKKIGTLFYVLKFYIKILIMFFLKKETIVFQRNFYYLDFLFNSLLKKNNLILITHDVHPLNYIVNKKIDTFFLRKSYKSYNQFIVHSLKNKQELHQDFGVELNNIKVIDHGISQPIGVTNEKKEQFISKYNLSKSKKIILFFGVVRKNKGIEVLLNSTKQLDKSEYQLVIAGKGNDGISKYIKEFIQANNLEENVIFINRHILEEEIPIIFSIADFNVLPYTYFHSQSGVLAQSISYLLPVVVTNVGSMEEWVYKYEIGLVCQANNHEELIKSIQYMIKDWDYNSSKENLENCRYNLLWENVVSKYKDIL